METVTGKLDQAKVKAATDATHTATITMIVLGFRERNRSTIILERVREELRAMGENPIEKDFMKFWRDLVDAGAGALILGRRGMQTRFELDYSLKELAKSAIEGHQSEVKKIEGKRKAKGMGKKVSETKTVQSKSSKPAMASNNGPMVSKTERLTYTIQLRPNYALEINLPSDATDAELEKVKNALKMPT